MNSRSVLVTVAAIASLGLSQAPVLAKTGIQTPEDRISIVDFSGKPPFNRKQAERLETTPNQKTIQVQVMDRSVKHDTLRLSEDVFAKLEKMAPNETLNYVEVWQIDFTGRPPFKRYRERLPVVELNDLKQVLSEL